MANEKRLIYANEVIEELTEERNNDCNRYMYSYQKEERDAKYDFAIEWLRDAPTVDAVEVVHGVWVGTADGYWDGELVYDMWECSECGFDADGADEKPKWNYCPNCGADMRDGDGNG